jgi:hypothetical protein
LPDRGFEDMRLKGFLIVLMLVNFATISVLNAQEFISPRSGSQGSFTVEKDPAKYFKINPGGELIFKVTGPNTIKVYGRIINPQKAGNASLMVYQGSNLIGAMLVTPKQSSDRVLDNKSMSISALSIQEFSVSEGEQDIKVKSSPKSPEVLIAIEVMIKKGGEQSLDLIPLVPLAPLVPPKKEEKPAEIELVPLVPLVPQGEAKGEKQQKIQMSKQADKGNAQEGKYKEIVATATPPKKTDTEPASKSISTIVETTPKLEIQSRVFNLSLDVGIILPSQSIGGPYTDAGLSFFFFPIKNIPAFGIGLYAGYHNLAIDIKDGSGVKKYSMSSNLIPVSLLLSYAIPVHKKLYVDIFGGGGISIVSADLKNSLSGTSRAASQVAPSFNLGSSLVLKLDKNNGIHTTIGYMGGLVSLDFVKDLDIGGGYFVTGYNFTF